MQKLATHLRTMQLVAHNGHNLVAGATFFADHKHFGKLYETYTEAYDAVVEKCIGLGLPLDLQEVTQQAGMSAGALTSENLRDPVKGFTLVLGLETQLIALVEQLDASANYGTKNFLQGLADQADDRCYQLKQRLK